jgi:chloramphenicol-sensitive protein RarD
MNNKGFIYACLAYLFWGIVPIYWKQIGHIGSTEIVLHRMVWAFVFVIVFVFILGQRRSFLALLKDRKLLGRLFVASILISVNWGVYIWAVNSDRIVDASMGYFINPLFSVVLGVIIFSERLRKLQLYSVLLAACGVIYLLIVNGELPIIALSLAATFSLYGVVKKTISIPASHGLAIETGFLLLPAIIALFVLSANQQGHFGEHRWSDIYLIMSGLMTMIPLLLFASAANKISLTALGMLQYIGPTIQLLIGVFLYNEPFAKQQTISFGLIWLAIGLFSVDQILHQRSKRRTIAPPPV